MASLAVERILAQNIQNYCVQSKCTPVKIPSVHGNISPCASSISTKDVRSSVSPIPSQTVCVKAVTPSCDTSDIDPYASPIAPTSFSIPPQQVRPLPKRTGQRRKNSKARVSIHTKILTSTAYTNLVEEEANKKIEKESKKNRRKDDKKQEKGKRKQKAKVAEKCKGPKPKRSKCAVSELFSEDENDAECFFCNEKFSNNHRGEGWIKCCVCLRWDHEACAGVDPDDADEFLSDLCVDDRIASVRKQLRLNNYIMKLMKTVKQMIQVTKIALFE